MSGLSVLLLASAIVSSGPTHAASYLYEPAFCLDKELRGAPTPYALRPGDICFAVNDHIISRIGHQLSGAGLPNHSMIVFAHPDGHLCILEAGPHSSLILAVNEAWDHLHKYEEDGARVWVRRRLCPLTPLQSANLACFCLRQKDKPFPVVRLLGQLTPFRSRGPVRTAWMGKPNPDRRTYFCSELVLNALIYAGVLDGDPFRPSATYPSDLFYGKSKNAHVDRGVRLLNCSWAPPARWTSDTECLPAKK